MKFKGRLHLSGMQSRGSGAKKPTKPGALGCKEYKGRCCRLATAKAAKRSSKVGIVETLDVATWSKRRPATKRAKESHPYKPLSEPVSDLCQGGQEGNGSTVKHQELSGGRGRLKSAEANSSVGGRRGLALQKRGRP